MANTKTIIPLQVRLFKDTPFNQEEANSIANVFREHLVLNKVCPLDTSISEGSIIIDFLVNIKFSYDPSMLDIVLEMLPLLFGIKRNEELKETLVGLSSDCRSAAATPYMIDFNEIIFPAINNTYSNVSTITTSFEAPNGDSGQIIAAPNPKTKKVKVLIALDCSYDVDQDKRENKL